MYQSSFMTFTRDKSLSQFWCFVFSGTPGGSTPKDCKNLWICYYRMRYNYCISRSKSEIGAWFSAHCVVTPMCSYHTGPHPAPRGNLQKSLKCRFEWFELLECCHWLSLFTCFVFNSNKLHPPMDFSSLFYFFHSFRTACRCGFLQTYHLPVPSPHLLNYCKAPHTSLLTYVALFMCSNVAVI